MARFTLGLAFFVWHCSAFGVAQSQEKGTFELRERFDPRAPYRVDVRVNLSGKLELPAEKEEQPQTVVIRGDSRVVFDEQPIADSSDRVLRQYREVRFRRSVGGEEQSADIRPEVRRMVVLRSEKGKKAPFSPDGPLMWGEIDIVRTDLFLPALVPALFPNREVKPGDRWRARDAAMIDLTEMDPIEEGELIVQFVSVVPIENRRYARLHLTGTIKGMGQDGPSRHQLEGIIYFDLEASRLSYLNINGVTELLGPGGKVTGRVDGRFVMERKLLARVAEFTAEALKGKSLLPDAENTRLYYENPELGIRFFHPRRWRVGLIRGNQVTLEEPGGSGILFTVEPPDKVPTGQQFLQETAQFIRKQGWTANLPDQADNQVGNGLRRERFGADVITDKDRFRLEYAVVSQPNTGGVTLAARIPWDIRQDLGKEVESIIRSVSPMAKEKK